MSLRDVWKNFGTHNPAQFAHSVLARAVTHTLTRERRSNFPDSSAQILLGTRTRPSAQRASRAEPSVDASHSRRGPRTGTSSRLFLRILSRVRVATSRASRARVRIAHTRATRVRARRRPLRPPAGVLYLDGDARARPRRLPSPSRLTRAPSTPPERSYGRHDGVLSHRAHPSSRRRRCARVDPHPRLYFLPRRSEEATDSLTPDLLPSRLPPPPRAEPVTAGTTSRTIRWASAALVGCLGVLAVVSAGAPAVLGAPSANPASARASPRRRLTAARPPRAAESAQSWRNARAALETADAVFAEANAEAERLQKLAVQARKDYELAAEATRTTASSPPPASRHSRTTRSIRTRS